MWKSKWPSWAPVPNKPSATLNRPEEIVASEQRSCVKVEVAILGSLLLISLMVSVDVKQHSANQQIVASEFRSCVKVKVAVLGSLSLISLMVSADVRQHLNRGQPTDFTRRRKWLLLWTKLSVFFYHRTRRSAILSLFKLFSSNCYLLPSFFNNSSRTFTLYKNLYCAHSLSPPPTVKSSFCGKFWLFSPKECHLWQLLLVLYCLTWY